MLILENLLQQFKPKTIEKDGCWLWQKATTKFGYAVVMYNRKTQYVHRLILEAKLGRKPDTTDHTCRNLNCINPDHLEEVTNAENIRRGFISKRKEKPFFTCGHPRTEENTIKRSDNAGGRCKLCRHKYFNDYQKEWRATNEVVSIVADSFKKS